MRRRRGTVATPGEWQCKTGGVRRLAVANGPNIFQMLLVLYNYFHYLRKLLTCSFCSQLITAIGCFCSCCVTVSTCMSATGKMRMCRSADVQICREENCLNLTLALNPNPVKPKTFPHTGSTMLFVRISRRAAVVAILPNRCHLSRFWLKPFVQCTMKNGGKSDSQSDSATLIVK